MRSHHLQILQLAEGASKDDIKAAYRRLSKEYHPDINDSPDAHERFLEIKAAYEYLTNEKPDETLYDYFDPAAAKRQEHSEQEAWRAEARRKAKEREQENQRHQAELIRKLVRYFAPIGAVILLFNVLLTVDYFVPRKHHPQEILAMSKGYETSRRGSYYRYDIVYFEDFTMKFDKGEIGELNGYDRAEVAATWIFQKPMFTRITIEDVTREHHQVYNVYIIFGYIIPAMLILCGLFFLQKKDIHRFNAAIVMFILSIFQLVFFF